MSKAVSALKGSQAQGLVALADAGLAGMITLRGDLASPLLAEAVLAQTGCPMPGQRQLTTGARGKVAWMSPDELLVMVEYSRAGTVAEGLNTALKDGFFTAANVSDARAMISLTGAQARDVLAKVCPVDFHDFAVGQVRRTRLAQVAAAIWREETDRWTLVCFRSVAGYVWGVLETVSKPGGEVGLHR
jgi:sarcosine oxidase subunit gamma